MSPLLRVVHDGTLVTQRLCVLIAATGRACCRRQRRWEWETNSTPKRTRALAAGDSATAPAGMHHFWLLSRNPEKSLGRSIHASTDY